MHVGIGQFFQTCSFKFNTYDLFSSISHARKTVRCNM